MSELIILAVAGAGMWALRASAIVYAGGRAPSPGTTRLLGYARHAVLAALVTSAIAGEDGIAGLATPSPQLAAAAVATLVAWRTGGILRTLAAGMATVLVLVSL